MQHKTVKRLPNTYTGEANTPGERLYETTPSSSVQIGGYSALEFCHKTWIQHMLVLQEVAQDATQCIPTSKTHQHM
jgi:hypothetical protein